MQKRIQVIALGMLLIAGALQAQAADEKKNTEKAPETAKASDAQADSITEGTVTVGGQAIAYTGRCRYAHCRRDECGGREVWPGWEAAAGFRRKASGQAGGCSGNSADVLYRLLQERRIGGDAAYHLSLQRRSRLFDDVAAHGLVWPRRVVTTDTVHEAAAPYKIVNNESSLLDVSDLVFIDAPATGFSRIFGKDKEKAFWGLDEDAHAFDRFIRRFLTKYGRWNSPKYLFGESYGTPRSAVLSATLQNVDLNGIILLSAILCFDNYVGGPKANPGVDQAYAIGLPTYAATAWYHHKLPTQPPALEPFLKEVEDYALGEYMSALLQGSELPEARKQAVAEKLHEYTGLPVAYLLKSNLRVPEGAFSKTLRDTEEMTVGRLDSRYQGPDYDPLSEEADYDPQSNAISPHIRRLSTSTCVRR